MSDRRHTKLLRRAALYRRIAYSHPFRLLDLPAGIRLLILRELLLVPEPIFYDRGWDREYAPPILESASVERQKLHPAILRVCKQLYNEGSAVLYENTVKCCIDMTRGEYIAGPIGPMLVSPLFAGAFEQGAQMGIQTPADPLRLARRQVSSGTNYCTTGHAAYHRLPSGLRHKMRKIHLEIILDVDQMDTTAEGIVPDRIKAPICRLAKFLEQHTQYQHISIDLKLLRDESELEDWHEDFNKLNRHPDQFRNFGAGLRSRYLQPFTYLRNRTSITVEGAAPDLERRLQLVTTDQPVLHLHDMYEVLLSGVHKLSLVSSYGPSLPYTHHIVDYLEQCTRARDEGDEDGFLVARHRLLSIASVILSAQMHEMLSMDRAHVEPKWRGPYMCPTKAVKDGEEWFDDWSRNEELVGTFQSFLGRHGGQVEP